MMVASQRILTDVLLVTDHNRIDMAQKLQRDLGDTIIVGEEISTDAGDIIGLYLKKCVQPYQSLIKTVQDIKNQGGLVYIPHPFETIRKGISEASLLDIVRQIDIIETQNGRAFAQNNHKQAKDWATQHQIIGATSSDAHHVAGLGKSYTVLSTRPTKETLVSLLASCEHVYTRPNIRSLTAPKMNRLKKALKGSTYA
jgi:predicted metal-dependent phosphoesterase TrpH